MRGDVALAGFVLTAEEWAQLEPDARSQLLAVALRRDEPWVPAAPPVPARPATPAPHLVAAGSGPVRDD
jgi:hypothetical protein